MTEEELFKKNFPEYVTEKGEFLSPYWDLFSAGYETGKDEAEADLATVAYMQGAENQKKKTDKKLTEAKIIIQDLLDNSDEYARQRAIDFLKEE